MSLGQVFGSRRRVSTNTSEGEHIFRDSPSPGFTITVAEIRRGRKILISGTQAVISRLE